MPYTQPLHQEIAKEVAKTLLSCVPLAGPVGQALQAAASPVLDRIFSRRKPQNTEEAVLVLAAEIVDDILHNIDPNVDKGAIESAMFDFRDTLAAAQITVAIAIDQGLDVGRLESYLLQHLPSEAQRASQLRSTTTRKAIRRLAHYLIDCIPEMPGFQLTFSQALLRRQDEMLTLLRELNQKG